MEQNRHLFQPTILDLLDGLSLGAMRMYQVSYAAKSGQGIAKVDYEANRQTQRRDKRWSRAYHHNDSTRWGIKHERRSLHNSLCWVPVCWD
jgi:hypothetical protein